MPRPVRPRHALTLAACAVLVAGCGGNNGQSTLAPQSRASREIATLWWWMLAIACVVFAGSLTMLAIAWVRRRREGMPVIEETKGRTTGLVIGFGIVIPIIVNVALFIVANFFVIRQTEAPAAATTSMTIQVVGRQWFWEVRYPGTKAVTANEIHIPVRTRVNVVATTGDVIHSFWVPELNRKIDMIPGRRNRVLLYADKPGRYRGQCAEFCGLQHAHMSMFVFAQTPQDYKRWLQNQAGARARHGAAAGRPEGVLLRPVRELPRAARHVRERAGRAGPHPRRLALHAGRARAAQHPGGPLALDPQPAGRQARHTDARPRGERA
jgi:cytochrome c oxidase subunit II